MFNMFNQLFAAFSALFSGFTFFAKAFENVGKSTELVSQAYFTESEIKHQAKINQLLKETKVTEKQLKAAA